MSFREETLPARDGYGLALRIYEADEPKAQDKPAKLRPGSRPSVTYLKMIEERGNIRSIRWNITWRR